MRTRYAITHVSPTTGLRTLTFANQGRNHYDSRAIAEEALAAYYKGDGLRAMLGDAADTLEVREVECYDHGDAIGIYFD